MKEINNISHSDIEVSVIASVLSYLTVNFKTDLIFGFGEGLDFRIEKDKQDKTFSLIPRVPYGMVIDRFFKNVELASESQSPTKSNINDILTSLESEEMVMISKGIADNIPVKDSKKSLNLYNDYIVIYEYNDKHTTIGVYDRKKPIVISSKYTENIILNSPKNKCIIFDKNNTPRKINIQNTHVAPLKNLADRFLNTKNKSCGVKAMVDFNKELKKLTDNYKSFVEFAENHYEIWHNQSPDKKGCRELHYDYINLLIKNVDDPTGEIKCAHEIYKEMKKRWEILNNLIMESAKNKETLEENKEEILHRYNFISVESESLAIQFLSELL